MRARTLALLVSLVACASPSAPSSAPSPSATPAGQRYAISTLVISGRGHGPQVCAGPIAESRPPICGGPAVVPWDWESVTGEESVRDVTWGKYSLVGTYDGTTFHLVSPPGPPTSRTPAPEPGPACVSPVGKAGSLSDDDSAALTAYVRADKEFAGIWWTEPGVMNVAFTGSVDRHRHDLTSRWDVPLCVVAAERTYAELERLQADVDSHYAAANAAGVHVLSDGIEEEKNAVHVTVLVLDDATRAWFARYGDAVDLSPELVPVGG
jgi:hypothetical protein